MSVCQNIAIAFPQSDRHELREILGTHRTHLSPSDPAPCDPSSRPSSLQFLSTDLERGIKAVSALGQPRRRFVMQLYFVVFHLCTRRALINSVAVKKNASMQDALFRSMGPLNSVHQSHLSVLSPVLTRPRSLSQHRDLASSQKCVCEEPVRLLTRCSSTGKVCTCLATSTRNTQL